MNDKIKKLAEQASHQSPDGYPITIPYSEDFAKKFADLIIKECILIIEIAEATTYYNDMIDVRYGMKKAAKLLVDKFGVN